MSITPNLYNNKKPRSLSLPINARRPSLSLMPTSPTPTEEISSPVLSSPVDHKDIPVSDEKTSKTEKPEVKVIYKPVFVTETVTKDKLVTTLDMHTKEMEKVQEKRQRLATEVKDLEKRKKEVDDALNQVINLSLAESSNQNMELVSTIGNQYRGQLLRLNQNLREEKEKTADLAQKNLSLTEKIRIQGENHTQELKAKDSQIDFERLRTDNLEGRMEAEIHRATRQAKGELEEEKINFQGDRENLTRLKGDIEREKSKLETKIAELQTQIDSFDETLKTEKAKLETEFKGKITELQDSHTQSIAERDKQIQTLKSDQTEALQSARSDERQKVEQELEGEKAKVKKQFDVARGLTEKLKKEREELKGIDQGDIDVRRKEVKAKKSLARAIEKDARRPQTNQRASSTDDTALVPTNRLANMLSAGSHMTQQALNPSSELITLRHENGLLKNLNTSLKEQVGNLENYVSDLEDSKEAYEDISRTLLEEIKHLGQTAQSKSIPSKDILSSLKQIYEKAVASRAELEVDNEDTESEISDTSETPQAKEKSPEKNIGLGIG